MKNLVSSNCLIFFLLIHGYLLSQVNYPKYYFRSPVDFRIELTGSFGEIRKNHFHSGIDIRTEGVEGKPIYAIADGFISRINISPTGFGKAVYITHPNGYISVYGHLKGFNTTIGAWTRAMQYRQESFVMDIPVEPGVLKVKKGEIIAYSGNSGTSGGPHLHFEIRDAATQETINPLLFGFLLNDHVSPHINGVKIYPHGRNDMVNFSDKAIYLPASGSGLAYSLKSKDTVKVSGNIVFGIETIDVMDEKGSKAWISSVELFIDSVKYFSQTINRFAFAETRYVNSLIDYPLFMQTKKRILRSFIAPNNRLRAFAGLTANGMVNFSGDGLHKVEYIVKDVFGNTSRLVFLVKSLPPAPKGRPDPGLQNGTLFFCREENHFKTDNLVFDLPKDALYEDLDFEYSETGKQPGTFSKIHHLHNEYTPIHSLCNLSIKANGLPDGLHSRAVIVSISGPGKFTSKGGKWENGYVRTTIREFGDYAITIDTIPPVIRPLNIANNKNLNKQHTISLKISDNLSGIQFYRGTLNGNWILMDYDAKNDLLVYNFDDRLKPGRNEFMLVVKDGVGNESIYRAILVR